MKKIIMGIIGLLMMFWGVAWADDIWYPANMCVIGWYPITTLDNGNPLPAGDLIDYNIYLKVEHTGEAAFQFQTSGVTCVLTIPYDTQCRVGIQAVRTPLNTTEEVLGIISWSDNPDVCIDNNTFGLYTYSRPGQVDGLHGR